MLITRKSLISNITRTKDLNITDQEIKKYKSGVWLQYAFPNLSDSEREFIKTGITDDEWDDTFGDFNS